jgi:hypothetical protein
VVGAAADLPRIEALPAQTLPSFTEHLLAMPQDDEAFEPSDLGLRDAKH